MTIDKSTWGPGEWQQEDDFYEWKYRGVECHIRRNPHMGNWCGYVTIRDPNHPIYMLPGLAEDQIDVHGGITYNANIDDDTGLYVRIGFDCGHAGDIIPGYGYFSRPFSGLILVDGLDTYKNKSFAIREANRMVDQLHELFPLFHKE